MVCSPRNYQNLRKILSAELLGELTIVGKGTEGRSWGSLSSPRLHGSWSPDQPPPPAAHESQESESEAALRVWSSRQGALVQSSSAPTPAVVCIVLILETSPILDSFLISREKSLILAFLLVYCSVISVILRYSSERGASTAEGREIDLCLEVTSPKKKEREEKKMWIWCTVLALQNNLSWRLEQQMPRKGKGCIKTPFYNSFRLFCICSLIYIKYNYHKGRWQGQGNGTLKHQSRIHT